MKRIQFALAIIHLASIAACRTIPDSSLQEAGTSRVADEEKKSYEMKDYDAIKKFVTLSEQAQIQEKKNLCIGPAIAAWYYKIKDSRKATGMPKLSIKQINYYENLSHVKIRDNDDKNFIIQIFGAGECVAVMHSSATGLRDEDVLTSRRAGKGETCGDGFYGAPKAECKEGLICQYPKSTAPAGPDGSSSALPGICIARPAKLGETCGDGFYGTPKNECDKGLKCVFPKSTAPRGPDGSSSAVPGVCEKA